MNEVREWGNPLFCFYLGGYVLAHKENVIAQVERLAVPVAEKLELTLWNIEFVKEGSTYYLRFFIDKEGGISIDDCEAFSRAVDPELDRADPIEQSYCLEVSSPGIERELKKDWHFQKYIGKQVKTRLIRPDAAGRRDIEGTLVSFDAAGAVLEADDGEAVSVKRAEAAYFRLVDDAQGSDNTITEE